MGVSKPTREEELVRRAIQWARSRPDPYSQRCSVCRTEGANLWLRAIATEWIEGRANHVSWPWLCAAFRQEFGTRTVYESIRNHLRDHVPDLWAELLKHGKAQG